jgi:ketosteroid isomerase-like protein
MDKEKAEILKNFSKAFNSNNIAGAEACTTEDFCWIFYEGTEAPFGKIHKGAAEACAAVVARGENLSQQIEFSEVEEYQAGDKVFALYRAKGAFHDTGPFDVRAIDVYSFRNDLLACKDTYWKIIH